LYNNLGNIINENFNVAIYIRLSKEDDNLGESESIQNQKTLLTKFVAEQNYNLVDIYIDDGYTGTNFDRPAFQRMLRDIKIGKINMVITKDLSRLSRDYIGTGEYVEKWFPAHGVRYIALTDAIDTAIESANNDIAPFKAILNDMYAKDLSKKIRTALHTMQAEGKWVGGCTPYGYTTDPKDKNRLIIDENEAPIVKRIFDMFLSGITISQICNTLNIEKVPTFTVARNRSFERSGNGGDIFGLWSKTTVKKMLQNRLYTGDMIQNRRSRVNYKYRKIVANPKDQWIIVEDTHEPIIDKKSFSKVQELLPKQKQRDDKKGFFLLDGLLKCADCGHNISIKARRANGKASTICNYYRKWNKQFTKCTCHGFDYDTLEKGVITEIQKVLDTMNVRKFEDKISLTMENVNSLENIKSKIDKLNTEITSLNNSLDKMYMDKLLNKVTEEMFDRVNNKITKEIEEKENKLADLKEYLNSIKKEEDSEEDLKRVVDEFLKGVHPTRELMLNLIDNIAIHEDGNIDIYFNFKELNIIYETCVT